MNKSQKQFKGQSLVMFAVMIVVFVGILALAIDGGMAYARRRQAQNAADAGALAGIQDLCAGRGTDVAYASAWDYAVTRNGAVSADITFPITPGETENYEIRVVAHRPYATTAMSFFGIDEINPGAVAEAACFEVGGANVLPIAYACQDEYKYDEQPDPDPLKYCDAWYNQVLYTNPFDSYTNIPLANMYIVWDSSGTGDDIYCEGDPNPPVGAVPVECSIGAGRNQFKLGGNKSWLDISTANITQEIENGVSAGNHTWYPGEPGVCTACAIAVENMMVANAWDFVAVPVFDIISAGLPVPITQIGPANSGGISPITGYIDPWGNDHPQDQIRYLPGASEGYFHIISFSIFVPTCVQSPTKDMQDLVGTFISNGNCPLFDELKTLNEEAGTDPGIIHDLFGPQVKAIEGYFYRGYVANVQGDAVGIGKGASYTLSLSE